MADESIPIAEAARIAGVSASTLKRWGEQGVVSLGERGWSRAAASEARVVARMRERGHSLEEIRRASSEGRLAFGYVEQLLPDHEGEIPLERAAQTAGVERELVERIMNLLGTPTGREEGLGPEDVEALTLMRRILDAGFPLVAFLQIVRVYAESMRKIAEAEVRLFHLFVHEPLIAEGVAATEIAEEMQSMAADMLPLAGPLTDYLHKRYLRFFVEQDVVGHMEVELEGHGQLGRVRMTFCFVDLTGFTRYTSEEGDEEALDLIERFVETVEATLPVEASIVKTIGDEVMIVSPDAGSLTEWSVGFLSLFTERPQPRVGIHVGHAVYRGGDYFGGDVNLAHRVVTRALGGEVMITRPVLDAIGETDYLDFDPIGHVTLKGFPDPIEMFTVSSRTDS